MAATGAEAKKALGMGVKRPRDVEMRFMRDTLRRELRGLTCPITMMGCQLLMPQRRHFIMPSFLMFSALVCCGVFIWWTLKTAKEYADIKRMHFWSDAFQHGARTIGHVASVACANEDLFGRLIFLFVGPCCGSRLTYSTPYNTYIAVHVCIVIFRFAGSAADDFPFMLSSLACCHLLWETFVTRRKSEEGALEKTRGMVTLAEDISYNVLNCFCDAVARVSSDLSILEDSPSLSTLLSRRASTGRSFLDLVNTRDRDKYVDFIKSFSTSSCSVDDNGSTLSSNLSDDHVDGLQLRSVNVYLEDGMNLPVEVHVFHARLETLDEKPFYLVGVMERESYKFSQKKTKTRSSSKTKASTGRMDQITLNSESGLLEPQRPAFDQEDAVVLSDVELLRKSSPCDAFSPKPSRGLLSFRSQRHKGSPRISSRDSLRASKAMTQRAAFING